MPLIATPSMLKQVPSKCYPRLSAKPTRERLVYWLTYGVMSICLVTGALQCYLNWRNVDRDISTPCILLDEEVNNPNTVFGTGINGNGGDGTGTVIREVDMSGYGGFKMATDSSNNSDVEAGYLYIVPTLMSNALPLSSIFTDTVYNITGCTYNISTLYTQATTDADSETTFAQIEACSASARLTTLGRSSIRYGRVEVKAKMPKGDWSIIYGTWLMSGEIDIVESRGNGPLYTFCGSNYIQGSLNWDLLRSLMRRKVFNLATDPPNPSEQDFHTYVLEWTLTFMRMYAQEAIFERGNFPSVVQNGSQSQMLQNPWVNGTNMTSFDLEFYLILNVAVGGTNGWFPDGQGDKPWIDASDIKPFFPAMCDFTNAQSTWSATWPEDDYKLDYMKMWRHCDY
ncbi:concanavalin A-like lectin/glucanase [Gymnopus androsaceus JB14]|uniref:Concanavalin A-like lectin/glucanase n=1 Tax=Gymnopus androsaceus JB14 TaxID=1447944 RepID=A0A6A4GIN2_9AGAR|nr:concanavalin A-like lectin/glucanase [Gymnopus androsaceus JB14]